MTPSERIKIIVEIASSLSKKEWPLVDLTLEQFELPTYNEWGGNAYSYIVEMIKQASDCQLTELAKHLGLCENTLRLPFDKSPQISNLSSSEITTLTDLINKQKRLMIAVSTGGPRIQETDTEYTQRIPKIKSLLQKAKLDDPNPFTGLWDWYGRWSDGSLPSYSSRRDYISSLYKPLLETLTSYSLGSSPMGPPEPTGWDRVDRTVDKIRQGLETARHEEDFQAVGMLCREAIISLAQAVYDPQTYKPVGNAVPPSETDANGQLGDYLAHEMAGSSNEVQRKFAKTALQLANGLQHRRTAIFRDAALCTEATRALINTIAIIAGKRDP